MNAAEAWAALGACRGSYLPNELNPRLAPAPKTHLRTWDVETTACGEPSSLAAFADEPGEWPTCEACLRKANNGRVPP